MEDIQDFEELEDAKDLDFTKVIAVSIPSIDEDGTGYLGAWSMEWPEREIMSLQEFEALRDAVILAKEGLDVIIDRWHELMFDG